jgi:hypothetical protein
LVDPTIVDPTTVNMGTTTVFKLGVTDANSGCLSADSMTVIVTGGALQVTASANPMVICQDDVVNLQALPSGGSGNNQFTWSSNPPGFTASSAEVSDYPMQTTTYTVSVFDGQNIVQASITVTVKPKPVANAGNDTTITIGTFTTISGSSASAGSGVYSYFWSPANMLMDPTVLHPQTVILDNSQEYVLSVHDANGCISNPDNMVVFASGDQLSITPTSSVIDNTICQGDGLKLFANAMGGGGDYTYIWTNTTGFHSTELSPTVSPMETTTYSIEVTDTYKIITGHITILVNHTPVVDLTPVNATIYGSDTIQVCLHDSAVMDANTDPLNPPVMDYLWSNNTNHGTFTASTNGSWIDFQTHSVKTTNPVTGCYGTDTIVLFFDFRECNIGIEENGVLENHVTISPNPTSGVVELIFTDVSGELNINLTDLNGKVLMSQKACPEKSDAHNVKLNMEKYPAGMYLISIIHKNGYYHASVIKN